MNSRIVHGQQLSGRRILPVLLFLCLGLSLKAASTWEGSAVVGPVGDFPSDAAYAACNSFPVNSQVQVQNLENGKTIIVTVIKGLDNPSIFMALSPRAASDLGMKTGAAARIRVVNAPSSATGEAPAPNPGSSADPDYNPSVLAYAKPAGSGADAASGKGLADLLGGASPAGGEEGSQTQPELESMPASSAEKTGDSLTVPVSPEPAPVETPTVESAEQPDSPAADSAVIVASTPEPESASKAAASEAASIPAAPETALAPEAAETAPAEEAAPETASVETAPAPEAAETAPETASAEAAPEAAPAPEAVPDSASVLSPEPDTAAETLPEVQPETEAAAPEAETGSIAESSPAPAAAAETAVAAPEPETAAETAQIDDSKSLTAAAEQSKTQPPAPEAAAEAPTLETAAGPVPVAENAPETAEPEATPAKTETAVLSEAAPAAAESGSALPAAPAEPLPEAAAAEAQPMSPGDTEKQEGELVYNLEPSPASPPSAALPSAAIPAPLPASSSVPAAIPPSAAAALPPASSPVIELSRVSKIEVLASGSYYVQIGNFSTGDAIKKAVGSLSARNYPLVYQDYPAASGQQYRLLVGPLKKDECGLLLKSIRALGYRDAFLKMGK